MDTYWGDQGNSNLRFLWSKEPDGNKYMGAYDCHCREVYVRDNKAVATLPDDLILDEALAMAKVIILSNRS